MEDALLSITGKNLPFRLDTRQYKGDDGLRGAFVQNDCTTESSESSPVNTLLQR
jgi:hypothetical protein